MKLFGQHEREPGTDGTDVGYRDPELALRRHREDLLAQRRAAMAASRAPRVYTLRMARCVAGAFLCAWALVLVGVAIARPGGQTWALLASAPVGSVGWILGRLLGALTAGSVFARSGALALRTTADVRADIARLDDGFAAVYLAPARRLESPGVALPAAGVLLFAPLVLHFVVSMLVRGGAAHGATVSDFDWWVRLSLAVVGHCHLLLVALVWLHARRLGSRQVLAPGSARAGWAALGWVVLASLIPGVLMLLVPVVLVAATGALIIPAAFAWMSNRVRYERALLGD